MSLLQIENISAGYGNNQVLRQISLAVEPGEVVTLIGANGAGKTTTLKVISGLLQPSQGSLRFMGSDITRMRPAQAVRMGIGHCPEERQLFPKMTVRENLEMGAYLYKGPLGERLDKVCAMFPQLRERLGQKAASLSGGEQQIVAIGRTLMNDPKLVLFDEPSLGLSPVMVREVALAIRGLNREGIAVLLVEQNVQMAFQVATKGYVLENGAITLEGDTKELAASDHVRQAFLGG